MKKWIVNKQGKIIAREGFGNKIECWVFLDQEPEPGDILGLEGNLYHILEVIPRANQGAYTLIMMPHAQGFLSWLFS